MKFGRLFSVLFSISLIGIVLLGSVACGDTATREDLREAEFANMPDEEMKRQWVLLDLRISELRSKPNVIEGRVEMLERNQKDLRARLEARGIDPDSIDSEKYLDPQP